MKHTGKERDLKFKQIERYRLALKNYLDRYPWQWFCTMNMDRPNVNDAERLLKKWREEVMNFTDMNIAYMGLFVRGPYVHPTVLRLCALGVRRCWYVPYLDDMFPGFGSQYWHQIAKRDAEILPIAGIEDIQNVDWYISNKNTVVGCFELIEPFNVELLKQFDPF